MTTDLILGTAGHIDHGKTALIGALTGIDTDRLPEEKKRGITIELGFAELLLDDYRLGVVDVPGHERFVRNMLAGATGMDLALLVVAADDSIKPQTREHLDILRLLELPAGVIALTKSDLVEDEWIELVEEEIRQQVAGTFLADAPIVRTSAKTGAGLDDLRHELLQAARLATAARSQAAAGAPFRMAIDRVFSIAGHGTVVTGSIASGQTHVGEQLVIEPGGISVRVRGLQNHDRGVQQVQRGQRAAINLAGVRHDEVGRGQELASLGHLSPSRLLTVNLSLIDSMLRPLKNRARLRLHVGTAELVASVRLLDREQLAAGESAPAQLFLSAPAVTTWMQPFVVRSQSPVMTVGGGQVLVPAAEKIRSVDDEVLEMIAALADTDPLRRASAALFFTGLKDWQPADLARSAGIDDVAAAHRELIANGDLREITISPTRVLRLHRRTFERLGDRIESGLGKMHDRQPLSAAVDRNQLSQRFSYLGDSALLETLLAALRDEGRITLTRSRVGLTGRQPQLSQNERKLLASLLEIFRQAGIETPTAGECQRQVSKNRESVPQLLELAAELGDLVEIAPKVYLHAEVEAKLRGQLAAELEQQGLTVSQIRELLGTSRKYALPYCEYLDRIGFTRREGDVRVLVQ